MGTYSHAFAAAVLALLPKQQQQQQQQQEQQEQDATQQNGHHHPSRAAAEAALAGSGLPELLLMSHHPAITAGVAKQLTAWQVAVKRLGGVVPAALKGGSWFQSTPTCYHTLQVVVCVCVGGGVPAAL